MNLLAGGFYPGKIIKIEVPACFYCFSSNLFFFRIKKRNSKNNKVGIPLFIMELLRW